MTGRLTDAKAMAVPHLFKNLASSILLLRLLLD